MTPQELKNSILQLAIQGKLVEQRAEEGTGRELLEEILATKNAEGAKGKEIKLTRSRGVRGGSEDEGISNLPKAAKSHHGKLSASPREEIPDDEKPFDIPECWEWVRLGEVVFNHGQKKPTEDFSYVDIGSIDNKHQRLSDAENIVKPEKASPRARKIIQIGDILYSTVRPYLHNICIVDREFSREPIASTGFAVMACSDCLDNKFLFYFLLSPDFDRYANSTENAKGVAYPAISDKRLYNALLPLPPLAEQKRIVAKIEELMPLVDRYEKAWSKLNDFNKRFPADMQKSLLQMAIQGKLVEQRAEEGTGRELLEKILAAKNAKDAKSREIKLTRSRGVRGGSEDEGVSNLPKAAKSHHGKLSALSASPREEIPDDEKPFDIPESWEWVRLEDLVIKDIKRGKSPTYTQKSGTLVFAQKCNTKAGVINLSLALFLDEAKLSKYPESEFMRDCDIVINSTGNGTLGRVGIYRDSDNPNKLPVVPDSHVTVIRVGEKVSVEYVFYGLKHYQPLLEKLCSGSTNQTELSASTVKSLLFPLPPLAEQKRIVAKIEELLPLCERLK